MLENFIFYYDENNHLLLFYKVSLYIILEVINFTLYQIVLSLSKTLKDVDLLLY